MNPDIDWQKGLISITKNKERSIGTLFLKLLQQTKSHIRTPTPMPDPPTINEEVANIFTVISWIQGEDYVAEATQGCERLVPAETSHGKPTIGRITTSVTKMTHFTQLAQAKAPTEHDIRKLVPPQYFPFLDRFQKKAAKRYPPS